MKRAAHGVASQPSARAFAAALETLGADRGELARLGTRASAMVQAEYSLERTLAEYFSVYDAVLAGQGA